MIDANQPPQVAAKKKKYKLALIISIIVAVLIVSGAFVARYYRTRNVAPTITKATATATPQDKVVSNLDGMLYTKDKANHFWGYLASS